MLKTPLNLAMLGDPEAQQFCEMLSLSETFAPLTDGGCGPTGVVLAVDSIRVTFPSCVDIVAATGIEVNIGGAGWEAVASVSGGSDRIWEFETTTEIAQGDVVLWQYLGGEDSIVDCTEAVDVGTLDPVTVRNPLELTAPTLVSAEVGTVNDSTFVLVFSEDLASADFTIGWTIEADATPLTITGVTEGPAGTLTITVAEDVYVDQVVTASYDADTGDIADVTGYPTANVLASITDEAVTNNSTTETPSTGPIFERDFTGNSIGANSTFAREGPAWHFQPTGVWAEISTNLPRFAGATWNGSAWTGTATGLLREHAATNLFPKSRTAHTADANWVNSGTAAALDAVGIDGASNAAVTLSDDSAAAQEQRTAVLTWGSQSGSIGWVFYIGKDTNQTRFPEFQLRASNNFTQCNIQVNTQTGAAVVRSVPDATFQYSVTSEGNFWRVVLFGVPGAAHTGSSPRFFPAVSTTIGATGDNTVTGSIVIDAVQCYVGETFANLVAMSPVITAGTAVTRAADALPYTGVAADNETRIDRIGSADVDIDDWDGTMPTPTTPVIEASVKVYAPGERP